MNRKLSIALIFLLILSFSLPGYAESWHRYKGNNKSTGRSEAAGPTNPVVLWKYISGDNEISSDPIVDIEGTIYYGTKKGNFYAINKDGSLKWRYIGSEPIISTPAVNSKDVYFTTNRRIVGLSKETGKEIFTWGETAKFINASNILFSDNEELIYVNEHYNKFHIIDITSKTIIKTIYTQSNTSSAVKDDIGNIYFTDTKYLYCISPSLVVKQFSLSTNMGNSAPVIDSNGGIYITGSISGSTGYGTLYSYKNKNGSLYRAWTYTFGVGEWALGHYGVSISKDNTIFLCFPRVTNDSVEQNLYIFNPDGTLKRKLYISNFDSFNIQPTIIDINNNIYQTTMSNELKSFNLEGILRWNVTLNEAIDVFTTPAFATDGTIYITTKQGNLIAVTDKSNLNKAPSITIKSTTQRAGNQDLINIDGIIKDENVGDKITIKYSIKNTPILNKNVNLTQPTSITSNGQNQSFQGNINLNNFLSGSFTLQIWAEDNKGAKSNIVEAPINIFNTLENILKSLKNYVYSEEVQFLIINSNTTITQNQENDILIEKIKEELKIKNILLYFIGKDGSTESYIKSKLLLN